MAVKQKPIPAIVKVAAKAVKNPASVTPKEIQSLGARILDDQEYAPKPHKPVKPANLKKK